MSNAGEDKSRSNPILPTPVGEDGIVGTPDKTEGAGGAGTPRPDEESEADRKSFGEDPVEPGP